MLNENELAELFEGVSAFTPADASQFLDFIGRHPDWLERMSEKNRLLADFLLWEVRARACRP